MSIITTHHDGHSIITTHHDGHSIITTHHDGHGLNEQLSIHVDERDMENGGASHDYRVWTDEWDLAAQIQFQHGPRNGPGSTKGITEAVLYAILIDRLEGFQAGPFACPENERQLEHLRSALAITRERANKRAEQGVLGKNETHFSA